MAGEHTGDAQIGRGRGGDTDSARISLRTKGIIAFLVLAAYVLLIGFMLAQQRAALRVTVEQQQTMFGVEESLARVNSALAYAILNVNEAYSTPNSRATADSIALDIEALLAGLQVIDKGYPLLRPWILRLERDVERVRSDWGSGSLVGLRESLHELVAKLDAVTIEARDRQQALAEDFRSVYDSITLTSLVMGLIGAGVFGGVVLMFFSRLVWDIRKLQARAMQVAEGYRGNPAEVTRDDELGALMVSLNSIQSQLREREKQLEIARQSRFHQDKMAAIGSLAAAIAHEVNNPMAAITGVAEAIHDNQHALSCGAEHCRPDLILEQTRRISQITRQLAEMTAPYSPEPQLLDLNALVRSTCGFVRYDKRFRNIDFQLSHDPDVPAVKAVADHLTQVLMNLMINAADATADVVGRGPSISVETRFAGGEVLLAVSDNGCGMDASTLARAFDEAFTTKPPGRGSGLGLFMCRSLVEAEGGRIELESTPGKGARARIHLPPAARS